MSKRKIVYVDSQGKITENPEEARERKGPKVRLNAFGEILDFTSKKSEVIGVTEHKERFYSKDGDTFLDYAPKDGKQKRIKVSKSVLGPIVNEYMNYLSDKGKIDLRELKNSEVIIVEGKLPGIKKEGKTKVYTGKCDDLHMKDEGTKKFIVIDETLSDKEKIATVYHELVHARGETDETKTQSDTIYGLREMLKSYAGLMKDEDNWDKYFGQNNDPDILGGEGYRKGMIRDAVNYAISARKSFDVSSKDIRQRFRKSERAGSVGKLEKKVAAIIGFALAFFLLSPKITGFAISSQAKGGIGVVLTVILVLILLRLKIKKTN